MSDFRDTLRTAFTKTIEWIGNASARLSANAHNKVGQINLKNRRREISAVFNSAAYSLYQKGERFPEPCEKLLRELVEIDAQLKQLKLEKATLRRHVPKQAAKPLPVQKQAAADDDALTETEEAEEAQTDEASGDSAEEEI